MAECSSHAFTGGAFQGGSSRHPRPQAWNSASNSFYSLSSCSLIIAILLTMQMIIAILITMQTMATILNGKGLAALGQHQHSNCNLDNYPFASVIIIIVKISMMIQMKWDLRRSICRAPNIFKLLPQKMSF